MFHIDDRFGQHDADASSEQHICKPPAHMLRIVRSLFVGCYSTHADLVLQYGRSKNRHTVGVKALLDNKQSTRGDL
jgi:hypothetical protein